MNKNRFSFYITLTYLVFGYLWILITDYVVLHETDQQFIYGIETLKGLFFVSVSALVVFLTSRILSKRLRSAEKYTERLGEILDRSNDAILIISDLGEIIYCNQGARKLYGWDNQNITGKNIYELINFDEKQLSVLHGDIVKNGEWFGELNQSTSGENEIVTFSRWTRIGEFEGHADTILIINEDLTELKELEQRLLKVQRLENLGLLSGGIAHDLNNVIQPIMMSVDILRGSSRDDSSLKIINMIQNSARRGSELVDQMLSFTRGTSSKKTLFDPRDTIRDLSKAVEYTFPENIKFECRMAENVGNIYGSRTQLEQVCMNLLINARDAAVNGGKVVLSADRFIPDDRFRERYHLINGMEFMKLRVSDNGIGISAENIKKIFEPFFTTKDPDIGTGLGLSTTSRIVKEEYNGFIEVESEQGLGTEFIVYIPVHEEKAENQEELHDVALMYDGKGRTIIIADNELSITEILRNVLESANYRVITVDNLRDMHAELLRQAELNNKVHVIITDLSMSGSQAAETIRNIKLENPGIKIIGISGSLLTDRTGNPRLNDEIDLFLKKPFSHASLLGSLEKILNVH